jgi:selenocysteine lyase/cysteine desulfurase
MSTSLINRDRSVVGAKNLIGARKSIAALLVGGQSDDDKEQEGDQDQAIIMGANATSLIDMLANMYCENGMLTKDDEIVIASENHLANVTPWVKAADAVGAKIKWWTVTKSNHLHQGDEGTESSSILSNLVNGRTKVVAVSHASNILGCVRNISSICNWVHQVTSSRGHIVVDGVAASPHLLSRGVECGLEVEPDWYVASLHKLFGPHLGCLIGKRSTALQVVGKGEGHLSNEKLCQIFEKGTSNYEACAGAIALKDYLCGLGIEAWKRYYGGVLIGKGDPPVHLHPHSSGDDQLEERTCHLPNRARLSIARTCIFRIESRLLDLMLGYLRKITSVRIIEDVGDMRVIHDDVGGDRVSNHFDAQQRIPIVSFVHEFIPSSYIVEHCRIHGVICRACKFLSTDQLWNEMDLTRYNGVVRFSLAHYNTMADIMRTINILERLEKW